METDTKIFKYLDRAFWMVWGALPFLVCIRLYYAFTFAYFNTEGQEIPLIIRRSSTRTGPVCFWGNRGNKTAHCLFDSLNIQYSFVL